MFNKISVKNAAQILVNYQFSLIFFLRYEPYYHKLQYSKVPKFDVAAAVFGAIVSAFVGYLTLSTLGSAGADLSDMLVLFWYIFLTYKIFWLFFFLSRNSIFFIFNLPILVLCQIVLYRFFMFLRYNFPKPNAHKQRKMPPINLLIPTVKQSATTTSYLPIKSKLFVYNYSYYIYSLGGGFLNLKVINYIFTHAKRWFRLLKKSAKIWINIPVSNILTKKPLNVRMGKGKGSRYGINARIYAGTTIAALRGSRWGIWLKMKSFIQARCSFLVIGLPIQTYFNSKQLFFKNKSAQKKCVTVPYINTNNNSNFNSLSKIAARRRVYTSIIDAYATLRKLKKLKLLMYFFRFFKRLRKFNYLFKLKLEDFEVYTVWTFLHNKRRIPMNMYLCEIKDYALYYFKMKKILYKLL